MTPVYALDIELTKGSPNWRPLFFCTNVIIEINKSILQVLITVLLCQFTCKFNYILQNYFQLFCIFLLTYTFDQVILFSSRENREFN